jgi:hypothetical protein
LNAEARGPEQYPEEREVDGVAVDDRHVSEEEARDALNPDVGGGTPVDAPIVEYEDQEPVKTWMPTRKWWAAFTGALASIAASWIVTGAFDDVERGMLGTALVSLAAGYWQNNDETPGGVPVTYERARRAP